MVGVMFAFIIIGIIVCAIIGYSSGEEGHKGESAAAGSYVGCTAGFLAFTVFAIIGLLFMTLAQECS